MGPLLRRTYPRIFYKAPIQFSVLNTQQFYPSRMSNFSAGGLCYESEQAVEPESEICIVMDNYSPDRFGPEAYRSYVARIRWTRQISDNGNTRYAAGVQFVSRSHDILAGSAESPRHVCDLCGVLMPLHLTRATDSGSQLCQPCFKHISSIPAGRLRQCVERFLAGNFY